MFVDRFSAFSLPNPETRFDVRQNLEWLQDERDLQDFVRRQHEGIQAVLVTVSLPLSLCIVCVKKYLQSLIILCLFQQYYRLFYAVNTTSTVGARNHMCAWGELKNRN